MYIFLSDYKLKTQDLQFRSGKWFSKNCWKWVKIQILIFSQSCVQHVRLFPTKSEYEVLRPRRYTGFRYIIDNRGELAGSGMAMMLFDG